MKPGGQIKFYGLSDWWASEFTEAERQRIKERYQPLGARADYLTKGQIVESTQSKLAFLTTLATWLRSEGDRHLGYACLKAAEPLFDTCPDALDRHFGLQAKCQVYYRWRNTDSFALQRAIDACHRSIDMQKEASAAFRKEYPGPLPRHACFQQLAIIQEKRNNFAGAVLLCDQAEAGGWGGDWSGRRERINRKWQKALKSPATS